MNFNSNFLCWNVRGLGDANKCAVIKNVVIDSQCDILCFQETKWSSNSNLRVSQICPVRLRNYAALDSVGSKGGVLLVWSNDYQTMLTTTNSYSITVILKRENFTFMLTGVYGPQSNS